MATAVFELSLQASLWSCWATPGMAHAWDRCIIKSHAGPSSNSNMMSCFCLGFGTSPSFRCLACPCLLNILFCSAIEKWAAGLGFHVAAANGRRRDGVHHLSRSTGQALWFLPRGSSVPRMWDDSLGISTLNGASLATRRFCRHYLAY